MFPIYVPHDDNHHATIITQTTMWSQKIMLEADILFLLKNMLIPKLTKRFSFAEDAGTSVTEYLDNSFKFFNYLRDLFYADRLKKYAQSRTVHDPCC